MKQLHAPVILASASPRRKELLERAGIPAVVRCRNGSCGFCHSRVVDGEYFIDSKDDFRRAADKKFNYIHPCSTYPESDMEIDIPIMNP